MRSARLVAVLVALSWVTWVGVAIGQTLLRDATGAVLPCQYFDESQQRFVRCGALPVGSQTGPATDPFGWGRQWQQATVTATAVRLPNGLLLGIVGGTEVVNVFRAPRVSLSADWLTIPTSGSVAWKVSTAGNPPDAPGIDYRFAVVAGGTHIVVTSGSGLTFVGRLDNWETGTAATGLVGQFWTDPSSGALSVGVQGTTHVILGVQPPPNTTVGRVCRSVNITTAGTPSYTCTTLVGSSFSTSAYWGGLLASPSLGIWLILDDGGRVWRSTNDAASFTQVATLTGGTPAGLQAAITCVSAATCVAIYKRQAWRSTDAGLTWTRAQDLGQVLIDASVILHYGGGVLFAPRVGTGTDVGWRSTDGGLSWSIVTAPANVSFPAQVNGAAVDPTLGRAYVTGTSFSAVNPSSAGRVVLVDPTGRAGVIGQGAPAAQSQRWPVFLSDGTSERGTSTNPLRVDPTGTTAQPASQGAGLASSAAGAPWAVTPTQRDSLLNQQVVSAANTAATITLAAAVNTRIRLYGLTAYCGAGATATPAVQVESPGGTVLWSAPGVGTTAFSHRWDVPLTAATNTAMVVTLGACGAGVTGTLAVQADRW